jgi:small basic protein
MIDRLRHSFGLGFIGLLLAGLFVPLTSCISSPSLTSITVTPATMSFGGPGLTTQLTATGSYTHPDHPAVLKDITDQVTWTSATPGCVTVSATGLITSQNATCSNILVSASAQGFPGLITGSMTVNVTGSVSTTEPITAVTIIPATLSVASPGQTGQFIAIGTVGGTGLQVNLTSQVAWSSSSSSVATIDATTGLATAVGAGTSNITAIWTNPDKTIVTGTAAFTVTGAAAGPLLSLSIIPNAQTMAAGQTSQLIAIGTFSTSPTSQNLTSAVTWSSSNTSVASISSGGLVTAKAPGTVAITAIASNFNGAGSVVTTTATFTVSSSTTVEPLVSMAILPASQTALAANQTAQFIAIGTTSSGTTVNLTDQSAIVGSATIAPANWQSSNQSVATIDPLTGIATAHSAGTTAITATAINPVDQSVVIASSVFTVSVSASPEPIVSMTILPGSQTANSAGQAIQYIAIGTTSTGATVNLTNSATWSSSVGSVASFSKTTPGLATALTNGATAVTAIAPANPGSTTDASVVSAAAVLNVNITAASEPYVSLSIVPASQTVAMGQQAKFLAIGTTGTGATVDLTSQATWKVSNGSVASIGVNSGIATPVATGATAITATVANPGINGNPPDGTSVTGTAALTVSATPEPLVSLAIVPASQTALGVNQSSQFIAIGTTASGATVNLTDQTATIPSALNGQVTIQPATWQSSNPNVASFALGAGNTPNITGIATSQGAGTTAITASATNPDGTVVVGTAAYTVTIPTVVEPYVSLAIVPSSQTITTGQTARFLAIGTTSSGATVDLTNQATWKVSNGSVASIGLNTGIATPIASGATAITATFANPGIGSNPPDGTSVTATAALTVTVPTVVEPYVSLSIVPASQTVAMGQTAKFLAIGTTSSGATVDLTSQATWKVSNGSIASIGLNSGIATPIASGATAITATFANPGIGSNPPDGTSVTATAALTVTAAAEPLVSLAIVPASQTALAANQPVQFIVIGTTSSGATVNLTHQSATVGSNNIAAATWQSSNPLVASFTPDAGSTTNTTGIATSQGAGTTAITATAINPGDNSVVVASAVFTVTIPAVVEPYVSLSIVPASQTVAMGQTAKFLAIGTTGTGATVDLTSQATWTATNSSVATFSSPGMATPVTVGATAITATFANPGIGGNPPDGTSVTASAALTVSATPEPLVSLAIVPASQTALAANQPVQFIVIGTTSSGATVNLTHQSAPVGSNTIAAATWQSSNPLVASFTPDAGSTTNTTGIATSQGSGTTAITASAINPDKTVVVASAVFTVTIPAVVEPYVSLTIVPASQTVAMGQTAKFLAIGTTGTGATVDLTNLATWKVSNGSIASIGQNTGIATPIAAGVTGITAQYANPGIGTSAPDGTSVTGTAVLTVSLVTEPLVSVSIVPNSQSVASPGETSQLLAIGTFSATPITQDVTSGLASPAITTAWSSSDTAVATVTTACPSGLTALSCTISACPGASAAGVCTSCPTGTVAVPAGPSCATLNPTTPMGLVTGVNQGTAAIVVEAANPDKSLVTDTAPFTVVGGTTEQYTALQIIPGSVTATSSAQTNQFIVLGTQVSSGPQYDLTGSQNVVWSSETPSVASICNANAETSPVSIPASCPTTPGLVTAHNAGTTNITATWTSPTDGSKLVAQATYTVNIGSSPEPLISINVVPTSTTVSNKGMTQQYLAFGTFTTIPTIRDITDSVTWISLSPNIASINSAGTPGEAAGVATALGEEGLGIIYAEDTTSNPDGTLVLSNPVEFTCEKPGVSPPICDQSAVVSQLATLTVFNAGSNNSNWLITAPSDQGVANLIHCGPGSEIAGLGNSVCTGTYASNSTVTITASLAGATLDNTFGGWTANCDKTTDSNGNGNPNTTSTCVFPNVVTTTGLLGNQSAGALFYGLSLSCSAVTSGTVGVAFNSGAITVTNGTSPYTFSVVEPNSVPVNTLPPGLTLNTSTGAVTGTPTAAETGTSATSATFSISATDHNGTTAETPCPITIN